MLIFDAGTKVFPVFNNLNKMKCEELLAFKIRETALVLEVSLIIRIEQSILKY